MIGCHYGSLIMVIRRKRETDIPEIYEFVKNAFETVRDSGCWPSAGASTTTRSGALLDGLLSSIGTQRVLAA